ncbi:MAG: tRNA (adenosine(37)-N6)-threonylcarbamoyltransferase complex dimerization subunit type 1 TsaB [Balneola sp.]
MILAYETSTNICSVAFLDDDGEVFEKRVQGRSVHSDNVFLFTQELMKEHGFKINDLEAVLTSNGPGSYTGLRIAASALKGLLFGTDVALFAINTLASFAMGTDAKSGETVHAIIDARRTHLYVQSFEVGELLSTRSKAEVMEISDFQNRTKEEDHIIGTGIGRISGDTLEDIKTYDESHISARSLIKLYKLPNFGEYGIKTEPEALDPNYISSSQVNNSNT